LISTQHIKQGFGLQELKDSEGNLTGHILGLFNRSIQLLENGIKPVWVFDGVAPELKRETLRSRKENKEKAEEKKQDALDQGDMEDVLKFAGQTVRVTPKMTADAKNLIKLLGLPIVEAPSEAEAQASFMAKTGVVYAVASEDMDCLCFGCPTLLRGFTTKDEPVTEIKLDIVLKEMDITMDQFIDICILCGCDYSKTIEGIGPAKAYNFIKENNNIEEVLKYIEELNEDSKKKTKYTYDPEKFLYKESRKLFVEPTITDPLTLDVKI
jgi:flap endonuclease-1